jgi:Tol biopolymer transport system component
MQQMSPVIELMTDFPLGLQTGNRLLSPRIEMEILISSLWIQMSNKVKVTTDPLNDMHPSWSPDGTKIAFESERDGNSEIYVINIDGSNVRRLTDDPGSDTYPVWSPDGEKIAFVSDRNGNPEIYVINSNGSNQVNITNNSASDTNPAWSPDGKKIAFSSDRDGNSEIYVMNADGSNQVNFTNNPYNDTEPAWCCTLLPLENPSPERNLSPILVIALLIILFLASVFLINRKVLPRTN